MSDTSVTDNLSYDSQDGEPSQEEMVFTPGNSKRRLTSSASSNSYTSDTSVTPTIHSDVSDNSATTATSRKQRKKKKTLSRSNFLKDDIVTPNRYQVLTDQEADPTSKPPPKQKPIPITKTTCKTTPDPTPIKQTSMTSNQINQDQTTSNTGNPPPNNNKNYPIPPLIIKYLKTHGELTGILKEVCLKDFNSIPKHDYLKVTFTDRTDYHNCRKVLTDQDIEHYTFPEYEKKPLRFVIRGLPHNTTELEVTNDLIEQGFQIKNVTQLGRTTHEEQDGMVVKNITRWPLFVATTLALPGQPHPDLATLQHVLHCRVTIEEPRAPKIIPMCFNCQLVGHTASFCHQRTKCVRCAGNHEVKACPNRSKPPVCANCAGQHVASYRGCQYHIRIAEKHTRQLQPNGSNHSQENGFMSRNTNTNTQSTSHSITSPPNTGPLNTSTKPPSNKHTNATTSDTLAALQQPSTSAQTLTIDDNSFPTLGKTNTNKSAAIENSSEPSTSNGTPSNDISNNQTSRKSYAQSTTTSSQKVVNKNKNINRRTQEDEMKNHRRNNEEPQKSQQTSEKAPSQTTSHHTTDTQSNTPVNPTNTHPQSSIEPNSQAEQQGPRNPPNPNSSTEHFNFNFTFWIKLAAQAADFILSLNLHPTLNLVVSAVKELLSVFNPAHNE
jgi:hypothetical protein